MVLKSNLSIKIEKISHSYSQMLRSNSRNTRNEAQAIRNSSYVARSESQKLRNMLFKSDEEAYMLKIKSSKKLDSHGIDLDMPLFNSIKLDLDDDDGLFKCFEIDSSNEEYIGDNKERPIHLDSSSDEEFLIDVNKEKPTHLDKTN